MACTNWFYAEDQDGNHLTGGVSIYKFVGGRWVWVINKWIDRASGVSTSLDSGTQYKAVPDTDHDGYITPRDITWTACSKDITLVYEKEVVSEPPVVNSITWSPKGSFSRVAVGATYHGRSGTAFRVLSVNNEQTVATIGGGASIAYSRGDEFTLDGEKYTVLHAIDDGECVAAVIAKNEGSNQHPIIGEVISFSANTTWNDSGATATSRRLEWFYFKPPSETYTKAYADNINNWVHFATGTIVTHTFNNADESDVIYIKVIARNKANLTDEFGKGRCSPGIFNVWSTGSGFDITVVDANGTDKLTIAEADLISGTNTWIVKPILMPFGVDVIQWHNVVNRKYLGISDPVADPRYLCQQCDPSPQFCNTHVEVGEHYAVFRSASGISVIDGKYVHRLNQGLNAVTVDRSLLSGLETTICGILGVSGDECTSLIAEMNDVVFVGNYYSIATTGKDMFGNVRGLTWFDHIALPFALMGTLAPQLPFGRFVSDGLKGLWKSGKFFSKDAFNWMETVVINVPVDKIASEGPWTFMQSIVRISGDHLDEVMELVHGGQYATAKTRLEQYLASDMGNTPYRVFTDFNDALRNYLPVARWEVLMDTIHGFAPQADSIIKTAGKASPTADDLADIAHAAGQSSVMDEATEAVYNSLRDSSLHSGTKKGMELTNILKNSPEIGKQLIKEHKVVINNALAGAQLTKDNIRALTRHGEFAPNDIIDMVMSYTPAERERIINTFRVDSYQVALSNLFYKMDDAYELVLKAKGKINTEAWVRGVCVTSRETLSTTFKEAAISKTVHQVASNQGKLVEDYCGGHVEPCFSSTSDAIFGVGKTVADDIVDVTLDLAGEATGNWNTKAKAYVKSKNNISWNWFNNLSDANQELAVHGMVAASLFFAVVVIYKIYSDAGPQTLNHKIFVQNLERYYWPCNNACDDGNATALADAIQLYEAEISDCEASLEEHQPALEADETYSQFLNILKLHKANLAHFKTCLSNLAPTGTIRCTSNVGGFYVWIDGKSYGHSYNKTLKVIENVLTGSRRVKIEMGSDYDPPSCSKTVTITSGRTVTVDCQMTKIGECSDVTNVKIYIDPLSPVVNETISFNGSATSYDPIDGEGYVWDFGDGSPKATGQAVSHKYSSSDVYLVRLTVTNRCGGSGYATRAVQAAEEVETGSIRCTSNQSGFEVFIDDKSVGTSYGNKLKVISGVAIGSHKVKIEKGPGYTPPSCTETVTVREATPVTVDCQMTPTTVETATLTIRKVHDERGNEIPGDWTIEIWVDGLYTKCQGVRTLTFGDGLKCDCEAPDSTPCEFGSRTITLKKAGYQDLSATFNLVAGDSKTWYNPVMKEGAVGPTHNIDFVVPVDSKVYVDGQLLTSSSLGRLMVAMKGLRDE